MKKALILALTTLLAATLLLSACDLWIEPFPGETDHDTVICYPDTEGGSYIPADGTLPNDDTELSTQSDAETTPAEPGAPSETTPVDPYAELNQEERKLCEVAAEALWDAYDLPHVSHFRVSVNPHASNGSNRVQFTLYIGKYRTDESYNVRVSAAGEVTEISGGYSNYHQFVGYATPEKIAAAEAVIGSGGYLTIDKEGWLCLSREDIVSIIPETDAEGNEILEGCGDHKHVFTHERICRPES